MTIKALCSIITPPLSPFESGNGQEWLKIENSLGLLLPHDYKDYIKLFGTGEIGSFLFPLNPFSDSKDLNLLKRSHVALEALKVIKDKYGEKECPYPLYPEPGGLLPWGVSENGDVLFWLTSGVADTWPVVVNESRGPLFEQYDYSMTNFLTNLFTGHIKSEILPVDFLKKNAFFTSLS